MRSVRRAAALDQECLPFEVPQQVPEHAPRTRTAHAAPEASEPSDVLRVRLRNDALASHGWPAGTELVVATDRRPRRGEVALVREGARLRIGVWEVRFGRSVLRTDHGAVLVGATSRLLGVATVAAAPLSGMP